MVSGLTALCFCVTMTACVAGSRSMSLVTSNLTHCFCVSMAACVAGSSSMTLLTTVCGPMDTGVCLLGRHDTAQWICGINGRQSHP